MVELLSVVNESLMLLIVRVTVEDVVEDPIVILVPPTVITTVEKVEGMDVLRADEVDEADEAEDTIVP